MEFLDTKDVARILQINISTAQKLFRNKNFPKVKGIGRKNLIEKETFIKYITNNEFLEKL